VETVSFTSMAEGTAEDYQLLGRYEERYMDALPDRLLAALDRLRGYAIAAGLSGFGGGI